ncbi:hypothetical protein [Enterobacter hormaechei]|uniref:hypothetical protein n=1 Tax=Enterobacter hormaechei TaxID=158836 RepID=UPI002E2B5151|nr:hypothetical protein [Enterobacter hormaechei]MED5741489.1 hypothetical protein [Enterobacter hormaechei]
MKIRSLFYFEGVPTMELIIKSALRGAVKIDDATELLTLRQICLIYGVSYDGVRQRMHRYSETPNTAINYFVQKQGGGNA